MIGKEPQATSKQIGYIKYLMSEKGFANMTDAADEVIEQMKTMKESHQVSMTQAGLLIQCLKSKPAIAPEKTDDGTNAEDVPW